MRIIRTRYHPGLKLLGWHIHQLLKTLLFVDGLSPHEKRRLCHEYDHRQDGQVLMMQAKMENETRKPKKRMGMKLLKKKTKNPTTTENPL